jgi:transposase
VKRNTVRIFYQWLRQLPSYEVSGEMEADEIYTCGVRNDKQVRGSAGKIAVFGFLKRGGEVYTTTILNPKTETLLPIIKEEFQLDSVVYIYTFMLYNALDVSDFHERRINHSILCAKL